MLLLFLNEQINASNHNVTKHFSVRPNEPTNQRCKFRSLPTISFFWPFQQICQKAMTNKFFFSNEI